MNMQARRYIFDSEYTAIKFCSVIKYYNRELSCLRMEGKGNTAEVNVDELTTEDIGFIEAVFDFADIDPETIIVRRERR